MDSRKRKKKKTTIVNKTRFAIFCLICLLALAFIFIKIFMPALNKNLNAQALNTELTETEAYVEVESSENQPLEEDPKVVATGNEESETSEESEESEKTEESEESEETEKTEEETELPKGDYQDVLPSVCGPFAYYNQEDRKWRGHTFGPYDPIWSHGCGPTVMASIVTTLTDTDMNPIEMSNWAHENGYLAPNNGSYHSLIPGAAQAFGLNVEPMYYPSEQQVIQTLKEGKYIVMVSGHGVFSDADGHFIIMIGIDENNKVQISDSVKYKHTKMDWDIQDILNEASPVSDSGGPFWAIWPKEDAEISENQEQENTTENTEN